METFSIAITGMAHGGDGVGRIDGRVCFVDGGLPEDQVTVRITRRTKNALWAEIVAIESPSPYRQKAACEAFGRCGACTWGHFSYPAQAEWKQQLVRDAFERIARIEAPRLRWVENQALRLGYRTRAEFHGDGENLGFYARGSHEIVALNKSVLCHEKLNAAYDALKPLHLKGQVTVTINPEGEEVLVWLRSAPRRIRDRFPLAGAPQDKARGYFNFDGVPIVNGTFSQSSLLLNRLLVECVKGMLRNPVSLLDLYCGNGNLSLSLAKNLPVTGIDHNREATTAANSISPGSYQAGTEKKMLEHIRRGEVDTILLDPPRAGAKALTPALAKSGVRALVYVSCDPATLARDLKTLYTGGWRIVEAAALDLFPHTAHVETVCRLER